MLLGIQPIGSVGKLLLGKARSVCKEASGLVHALTGRVPWRRKSQRCENDKAQAAEIPWVESHGQIVTSASMEGAVPWARL